MTLVTALLVVAVIGLSGADSQRPAAAPVPAEEFAVFDNSQYVNVDLHQLGLIRSGIVEETQSQAAAIRDGGLPDRTTFARAVTALAGVPGPLVLDYEDLYLTGPPARALFHMRVLTALTRWARAAAPGKVIGFYGVLDHTDSRYRGLLRRLAPLQGAFIPSLYAHNQNRRSWSRRLAHDVALAHAIAPTTPVYAYLWPQYAHPSSAEGRFIGASDWAFQLDQARRVTNGVVIWSKKTTNRGTGWLRSTAQFMRRLLRARSRGDGGT